MTRSESKTERLQQLVDLYIRKGCPPHVAEAKAALRYEVETTSPGPMAWLGGIGLAVLSWGLIPLGVWLWEQIFDVPGHTRGVFRWAGRFWTLLLAIGAAIAIIVVIAQSGESDSDQISKRELETAVRQEFRREVPSAVVGRVDCDSGINEDETVECLVESQGQAHRFAVSAAVGARGLRLTVDVAD